MFKGAIMSRLSDQNYLLTEQYGDASNLNARIELHRRFSVNRQGWHHWIFDQFHIPVTARLLELGCGPGLLWRTNLDRIPAGWNITLSDFSTGMLAEARQNLAGSGRAFAFETIDAQSIPYADGSFDAVIANHMLYHVPDRPRALGEMRRVMRNGGRFYASTVGGAHLRELKQLVQEFKPDASFISEQSAGAFGLAEAFTLEGGREQLAPFFTHVDLHLYDDALVVTEAAPLVAYVLSGGTPAALQDHIAELTAYVEQRIRRDGAIRITKSSGMFEAF
jgi:SAM-dependent methyltransferase